MKKRQLLTVSVLAAVLLASVSCGAETTEPKESTESTNLTTETEAVTETIDENDIFSARTWISDDLPDANFNGKEFAMLAYTDTEAAWLVREDENGDSVNDAIYDRKIDVEERFNAKVRCDTTGLSYDKHVPKVASMILADDDAYDLYMVHSMAGPNIALQGVFVNLYDVPHLNFSKPWWPEYFVEEQTLMGQLYCFINAMSYEIISGAEVLYFNRSLLTDYDMPDPYQLVLDGKWTIDVYTAMLRDTYRDLNMNDKQDMEDFYGYAGFYGETYYSQISADLNILDKTKDSLSICVNNEKTISYIEKMYDFFFSDDTHMMSGWSRSEGTTLFLNGQTIAAIAQLNDAGTTFRNSDINFAIVPEPKFDETQEHYITTSGRALFGIPVTEKDLDFVGIILEALSAEGYKSILPTWYESAFKYKFMRDEENRENALAVMKLIESSLCLPFNYTYGNWGLYTPMCENLFQNNSKDFASYYASTLETETKRVNTILDFFTAHKDD